MANKIINSKQCIILWHVADLKISHEDPAEVTKIIKMMSSEFGKEAPLTVRRGKIHAYLGMNQFTPVFANCSCMIAFEL